MTNGDDIVGDILGGTVGRNLGGLKHRVSTDDPSGFDNDAFEEESSPLGFPFSSIPLRWE